MEKKQNNIKFKFIDLFAGIGGIRAPFEKLGGKCVFTSEWDKYCQITYQFNFGERPFGDITKIDEKDIPDHDILLAGFPCQPFSIAGVSKKNSLGLEHGFKDKKQGNLFFEIARILKEKKPKAFMLENVKNLKSHDGGRTFKIIENTLLNLGYDLFYEVIDAANFVPQHRERILIVGFRKDIYPNISFVFPDKIERKINIVDILEKKVDEKYTLSTKLWKYLQGHAEKHKKMGNGFGFGLIDPEKDKTTRTLSARYYKDGSEILIKQKDKNPRRLTPRECARLMGFSDTFKVPVSNNQAYKQFGNAVVIPVIEAVAKEMIKTISNYEQSFKKTSKLEYVKSSVKKYQLQSFCPEVAPI
jgi:DNA (cytosine-5)-methyltransferase 1